VLSASLGSETTPFPQRSGVYFTVLYLSSPDAYGARSPTWPAAEAVFMVLEALLGAALVLVALMAMNTSANRALMMALHTMRVLYCKSPVCKGPGGFSLCQS
jgi:hypothetical protein